MTTEPPPDDEDREKLVAYLDGELEPEAARAVEAKLNVDPEARSEAEALKRTWDLLDYLPKPEPSPNFTHRTLDRISALRPAATTGVQPGRRPWLTGLRWAAAALVAWAVGFAALLVYSLWIHPGRPAPSPEEQALEAQLVRDLPVLENLHAYLLTENTELLLALAHPDLFGDDTTDPQSLAKEEVVPPPEPTPEELEQNRRQLEKWRADPPRYERLRQDLQTFAALPRDTQERLRRIDHDLREEEFAPQLDRVQLLDRYLAWLGGLPEDERKRIRNADAREAAQLIRERREQEWLKRQPRQVRELAEKMSGAEPTTYLTEQRQRERQLRQAWAPVVRSGYLLLPEQAALAQPLLGAAGGTALASITLDPAMVRLLDFPEEVQNFVYGSLKPMLSTAEQARLEGWRPVGELARSLVALTDRYGWAVPGSSARPQYIRELPGPLPRLLTKPGVPDDPKEGEPLRDLRRRLNQSGQKWPDFGIAAMEFAQAKKVTLSPNPPWAPCRPNHFAPSVQLMLDRKLLPALSSEETKRLREAEGHWPKYPQTLAELARSKGLQVPEMSLPGARDFWSRLCVALPEVPERTLLEFAFPDLSADERAGLQVSFRDPVRRERLKEAYYRLHPKELPPQLQAEYQKRLKKEQARAGGK